MNGINDGGIAYCEKTFEDGLTFEIWNYFKDPEKLKKEWKFLIILSTSFPSQFDFIPLRNEVFRNKVYGLGEL